LVVCVRYDFVADRWPEHPDEAAGRNGAIFHALAKRGVSINTALIVAEMLEHGETVEGVEVELVFSHGELEAQLAALEVTATCTGGEPREPFMVDLRPTRPHPWTKAVRSGLKNWGLPEAEAEAIATRIVGGETVEGVALPGVPTDCEELVVEQFEGYGVLMTRAGEWVREEASVELVWELEITCGADSAQTALAIQQLCKHGATFDKATKAIVAASEGKAVSVTLPEFEDERLFVHKLELIGIAVRKVDSEIVQHAVAQIEEHSVKGESSWELTRAGDIKRVRSILAIRCLHLWGSSLLAAKRAVEAAMDGRVAELKIPVTDDFDAFIREMRRFGIAVRKVGDSR
jgi:hypothetical protein